jgi:hypothetical protein
MYKQVGEEVSAPFTALALYTFIDASFIDFPFKRNFLLVNTKLKLCLSVHALDAYAKL